WFRKTGENPIELKEKHIARDYWVLSIQSVPANRL
ncbi:hypothetical protein SA508_10155, partial [Aggregatibacter actinomycetemcomitans serotype d str. SA508]